MRSAKIGRNQRCPCGSGKKYKQCCERKQRRLGPGSWAVVAALAAAGAVLVFFLYNLTQGDSGATGTSCPPGQVWSPEHGHCHDI
ncbi:MAG TPA: SEC-C metal-binding domain-containing protein [Vicinamibacteria bacterium]|nr:SEC-C metal-binding domain-containing protein [Vicinamibacteria bacterium]